MWLQCSCSMALWWQCVSVSVYSCRFAVLQYGSVAVWQCSCSVVAVWQCASVAVRQLQYGCSLAVRQCGSVADCRMRKCLYMLVCTKTRVHTNITMHTLSLTTMHALSLSLTHGRSYVPTARMNMGTRVIMRADASMLAWMGEVACMCESLCDAPEFRGA